jgi:hypothetical protein
MNGYYVRATVLGAVIWGSSTILIYMILGIILKPATPEVSAPESNFEVVDSYKGCDVVRYDDNSATYKYFLHCPGN